MFLFKMKNTIFKCSLIIIVILFSISYFFFNQIIYKKLYEDTERQIFLTSKNASKDISHIFKVTSTITNQMETNKDFWTYLSEVKSRQDITTHELFPTVIKTLKTIEETDDHVYLTWVANENANFYLDCLGTIGDKNYRVNIRPWYNVANSHTDAAFTKPFYEYTRKVYQISCIKALREKDEIIGYISADISMESFIEILNHYYIGELGHCILIGSDGSMIAIGNQSNDQTTIENFNLTPYMKEIKTNQHTLTNIEINNIEYYTYYDNIDENGWAILQLINKSEAIQPFRNTMKQITYVFLVAIIILFFIIFINIRESFIAQKVLKKEASTDFLTKVYNRKFFFEQADHTITIAKHNNIDIAMFMIDIDGFKWINDTYGHNTGDFVLTTLADNIKLAIRKNDILCRFGGDEFAVLLTDANKDTAKGIANRILKDVSALSFNENYKQFSVTVSIGISLLKTEDANLDSLLARADIALYEAKRTGKNKGCLYTDKVND